MTSLLALIFMGYFQNFVRNIHTDVQYTVPAPPQYLGLNINSRIIRRLLGLKFVVADLVWIDLLVKADLSRTNESFSPLYHAIKTVVRLDPDQLFAFYVGGMYLSIIKDDIKGATAILREGAQHVKDHHLENQQHAWKVFFMLGYNLIFEELEIEEGSRWIEEAGTSLGAPKYVTDLATHVSTENGRLEIGARVLADLYRRTTNLEDKRRIEKKMLELAERQELVVLNEKFQRFLQSTDAFALEKEKAFRLFVRSESIKKEIFGKKIHLNTMGKIDVHKR